MLCYIVLKFLLQINDDIIDTVVYGPYNINTVCWKLQEKTLNTFFYHFLYRL